MLFNSFDFFLFFPIVTLLYFLLPYRFRWFHLLVASCIFYMFFVPVYILILFFTIVIDYFAGIMIEKAPENRRKPYLVMSIVANVGVLAFFKYYNFFSENFNFLFHITNIHAAIPLLNIVLPIGLSFHTFQAMSYTIEVYRGNQKAEHHFGIYALYVMFFPQLVAGPIERPQNMLHQFHEKHDPDFDNVREGLKQMLWGFFKKIVIADRLALVVNNVYRHPDRFSGPALLIAAFFFCYQLYCDFSGYSDIAIGSARVMGYRLMVNFDLPYQSKSISEFWRRWHISLSTWFYDYVYNPVVTALRSWEKRAVAFGLVLTFFLSGFWHGTGWHYIIWGLLHGVAVTYEFYTRKFRKRIFKPMPKALNDAISRVLTFVYVLFTLIFFRAASIHDALYVVSHLFSNWHTLGSAGSIKTMLTGLGGDDTVYGAFNMIIGPLLILLLALLQGRPHKNITTFLARRPTWAWSYYALMVVGVLFLGVYEHQQFIYFQF